MWYIVAMLHSERHQSLMPVNIWTRRQQDNVIISIICEWSVPQSWSDKQDMFSTYAALRDSGL